MLIFFIYYTIHKGKLIFHFFFLKIESVQNNWRSPPQSVDSSSTHFPFNLANPSLQPHPKWQDKFCMYRHGAPRFNLHWGSHEDKQFQTSIFGSQAVLFYVMRVCCFCFFLFIGIIFKYLPSSGSSFASTIWNKIVNTEIIRIIKIQLIWSKTRIELI